MLNDKEKRAVHQLTDTMPWIGQMQPRGFVVDKVALG
jgi:hypothetical protein